MDNIIKKINSCSKLSLRRNGIGVKEAIEIAKSLLTNNCLHTLNLNGNNIGTEGAIEIAKSLLTNNCLRKLYLRSNNIDANGAAEIITILEENYTLTKIDLGNGIDSTRITNRNKDLLANRRFTNTKLAAI